ncbi:MAG: 23S rRNA (pseudouridine(1915)-N(3))-methyltransferase RlmH [Nitrospirota bacterium]
MPMCLLFVGKTKEGFVSDGVAKYLGLLRRQIKLEIREIKGSHKTGADAVKDEGAAILKRISPSDYLVALHERGNNPDSREFAGKMAPLLEQGRNLVFAVGGPFGLSREVLSRADYQLSLSRLTFTHEMARLILMEQIYRALTIIQGRTYHY